MDFRQLVILALLLCSCQSSQTSEGAKTSSYPVDQPLVEEKYKLSQNQQAQMEPELKTELDEKNYIQGLFQETKKEPSKIRSQFDQALRKKRELFRKDHDKKRAEFSRNERVKRQDFLKGLEAERQDFKKRKVTREERNDFFSQQDQKRKNHFAEERDARAEFESEMRDRQKNFEDYAKEKHSEFNQEYQAYIKAKSLKPKSEPMPPQQQ